MDALGHLRLYFTAILSSFLLMGCQITYLAKSAYNQMNILYHREPIEKVLQRDDLTKEERAKLELTMRIRSFAQERLQLKVGKNYSTYVQLKRPYVVWAVNASPKWRLEHYLWHFPIVGSVPYKGFPDEADATEEAKNLQAEGYDTFVRGVSAYSTLGWFSDPLLSSMVRYSEEDLVNTIIHESVHSTLYIKSNADFNERLASFVGDKGTEIFYLEIEGPNSPHIEAIKAENEDQKTFSKFISEEIKLLNEFYKDHKDHDIELRETKFAELQKRFRENVRPRLKSQSYGNFDKIPLNNARLMLFRTYIEDLSDFQRLLDSTQGNLVSFLEKVKTLESHPNPVEGLKELY
jgi:predicted aminopeptidase